MLGSTYGDRSGIVGPVASRVIWGRNAKIKQTAALEVLGTNVMLADSDLRITYINPALWRLLSEAQAEIRRDLPNFDANNLVGHSINAFHKFPERQRGTLTKLNGLHKATIRVGGRIFDLSINPLKDDLDRPSGYVVEWVDAAQRIANSEYKNQMLAVNQVQAVIEFTLDGTIVTANENFVNLMGYTLEELQNRHHSILIPPEERGTKEYSKFWEQLNLGQYQAGQFRRIDKNKRDVWIKGSYYPIFDGMGKPYKVIKFATDITRQIELQNDVKQVIDTNFGEINHALEQVRHQAATVATAANETNNNVETLAAGGEELAVSAREISHSMSRSREATEKAVREADAADLAAQRLTDVARAMGGIVSLIRSIAARINLLALNATIEAARAGDAGRGFAVVATEVKNLANQSANATEQITREIEGMQAVSSEVAGSLSSIRQAMINVEEFVTASAGAVEEQSTVTRDMSDNMSGASIAVETVTRNINDIINALSHVAGAVERGRNAAQSLTQ